MIHKRVRETVRKAGEQKVYQTIKREREKHWAKQRALRASTNTFVRKQSGGIVPFLGTFPTKSACFLRGKGVFCDIK